MENTPWEPNRIATPGIVTIDGEDSFEAAHIPPLFWNGFVCPAFTLEQAHRVTEWANREAEEFPESTTFQWVGVTLYETNDYGDGPVQTVVGTISIDGVTLYCISDGWTWSTVEDENGEDDG